MFQVPFSAIIEDDKKLDAEEIIKKSLTQLEQFNLGEFIF